MKPASVFFGLSTVLILLVTVFISACSSPLAGTDSGFLPVTGDYPGLIADGKRKTYIMDTERDAYLGNNVALFENYGLTDFFHNSYTLNGDKNYLSIESYNIAGDNGAAGVFYYFVRRKLSGKGKKVQVGADGVLDVANDGRNLYFFKGRWFFALVYSGKENIPDLLPLARLIAGKVPGNDWKPDGFRYLEVEGISSKYAYVSAGNAMNFAFLPPSVTTFVSSAGMEANIYVSNYSENKDAEDAADDFRTLLRSENDYKKVPLTVGGKKHTIYQALDEKEGLLMFVQYRNTLISISHVTDEAVARLLLSRVLEKIQSGI